MGAKSGLRAGIALAVFLALVAFVFVLTDDPYLWIKAFHVMAVIAWMAGLFYLPRLFIYHHASVVKSETSDLFKIMENRLYKIIMMPSMVISWLFGLYSAYAISAFSDGWFHVKLLAVVVLTIVHFYYGSAVASFGRDERPKTQRHWRIMNEAPALLMIVIVLMVILKPF